MADTETTEFVMWHMVRQEALDKDGNIWKVAGWYDQAGNDLPMIYNQWDAWPWCDVDYVTVYRDTPERRLWSTIRPDDFTSGTN